MTKNNAWTGLDDAAIAKSETHLAVVIDSHFRQGRLVIKETGETVADIKFLEFTAERLPPPRDGYDEPATYSVPGKAKLTLTLNMEKLEIIEYDVTDATGRVVDRMESGASLVTFGDGNHAPVIVLGSGSEETE